MRIEISFKLSSFGWFLIGRAGSISIFKRAHCGIFENGVLLMYTLEGVSSVANFITAYEESH